LDHAAERRVRVLSLVTIRLELRLNLRSELSMSPFLFWKRMIFSETKVYPSTAGTPWLVRLPTINSILAFVSTHATGRIRQEVSGLN
jgi:hypothetical protein